MTDDDTRVTCTQCTKLRNGRCLDAKRAGLSPWASIEVGTALANLPQRCPVYQPKEVQE